MDAKDYRVQATLNQLATTLERLVAVVELVVAKLPEQDEELEEAMAVLRGWRD